MDARDGQVVRRQVLLADGDAGDGQGRAVLGDHLLARHQVDRVDPLPRGRIPERVMIGRLDPGPVKRPAALFDRISVNVSICATHVTNLDKISEKSVPSNS